jgi:SAM-dependent methyltransferase
LWEADTVLDELKARQAAAWGSGAYELFAETLTDIYDDLIARLGVRSGERWLDVATGTGAVAIRAAQLGALVTGQDFAEPLIERARCLAIDAGVEVAFDLNDCEQLPYQEAAFDVVSSAQGAVLAPDHRAVAGELARVCAKGGRLGLTAWRPGGVGEDLLRALASFRAAPAEGAGAPLDWGRPEYVRRLLGGAFRLEFFDGVSYEGAESPEALWQRMLIGFGPLKTQAAALSDERRGELHDAFVDFYASHLGPDGRVAAAREYLVIVGMRR